MKIRLCEKVFGIACLVSLCSYAIARHTAPAPPTTAPAPAIAVRPSPPVFIVAVTQQPAVDFAKWKSLGINTVVDVPQGHDPVAWAKAAEDLGLFQMRHPIGKPADDYKLNPHLIAFTHEDEPDLNGTTAATLQAEKDATKGVLLPWFINFDGSRVLGIQPKKSPSSYAELCATADWLCNDIYPVTGWDNNIPLWSVGAAVDSLATIDPDKPQFIYVECSRQNLGWVPNGGRCVTPDEMSLIIRQGTSRGVKGIIYFPFQIGGGFVFDVSPVEIKERIARWSDTLKKGT